MEIKLPSRLKMLKIPYHPKSNQLLIVPTLTLSKNFIETYPQLFNNPTDKLTNWQTKATNT